MANSRYRDPKTFGKKTLVLVMVATIVASAIMVNDIAITPAADFMFGAYGDATNFILSRAFASHDPCRLWSRECCSSTSARRRSSSLAPCFSR